MLRRGDTLIIKSLDRLSRNKADIKKELEYFKANGIRLKVLDLPTTLTDCTAGQEWIIEMVNNVLIEVLASIAQQEREMIRARQQEGIVAAKARGAAIGRPKAKPPADWQSIMEQWHAGSITAKRAMELSGLKRSTFYKLAGKN